MTKVEMASNSRVTLSYLTIGSKGHNCKAGQSLKAEANEFQKEKLRLGLFTISNLGSRTLLHPTGSS
jgi:hypothetical protein